MRGFSLSILFGFLAWSCGLVYSDSVVRPQFLQTPLYFERVEQDCAARSKDNDLLVGTALRAVRSALGEHALPRMDFMARGQGYSLSLSENEATLILNKSMLRMCPVGANTEATAEGLDPQKGKINYFKGKDPAAWKLNIPTFGKVRYSDVWPGIDLIYYGNQRQLEYDFVVAPGADPEKIAFLVEGADSLRISEEGNLVLGFWNAAVSTPLSHGLKNKALSSLPAFGGAIGDQGQRTPKLTRI